MIRQYGSKMCFVCGVDNPIGLHLDFWIDGEQVWTDFTPGAAHQGYPGVMHGGLAATVLDETMGRAAALKHLWMFTAKMEITYRRPVPLGQTLRAVSRIDELRGSRMLASGQILLPDGTPAVEGKGLYLRVPEGQLEQFLAELREQGMDVSRFAQT